MSNRAEEAALKAYPVQDYRKIFGFSLEYSYILARREAFKEGYEQAEKETIERAVEYIKSTKIFGECFPEDFRKSLEEE